MIGFIGTGNMATAMVGGILKSGIAQPSDIIISDNSEKACRKMSDSFPGIQIAGSNVETAGKSSILILSVKPHIYPVVAKDIRENLDQNTLIVTIAAGVTLDRMSQLLGQEYKVIRTMPNTPALVGEGMAALCPNEHVSEEELKRVEAIFQSFGRTERLPESQINAFTSLCGSSPAWIFMAIESLADGAVLQGIPRDKAYPMAAQSVLGAAKMVLETGEHPGQLKDKVSSPGGTTIEAIAALEKRGFRSSLIEAVEVCTEKANRLSGD